MVRFCTGFFVSSFFFAIFLPVDFAIGSLDPEPPVGKIQIRLKPSSVGAYQHLGGMLGLPIPLSKDPPLGLKNGLEDSSTRYGWLPTRVTPQGVQVAVTETADSQSGKLFIDNNGDGDFANDPMPKDRDSRWALRGPVAFQAEREVRVGEQNIRLSFFRYTNQFAKGQKHLEKMNNPLFVHRDDVLEGKVQLGNQNYSVMLFDRGAHGHFDYQASGSKGTIEPGSAILFLDRDHDGKYNRKIEEFDLAHPFTINGVTYELDKLSLDGKEIILRRSANSVPEIPMPLTAIGRPVPPFQARLLDGGELHFPEDCKGKIVLFSFWATWCAPCIGHMPELVATGNRLKPKGIEIIGICLDKDTEREKAAAVCKKLGVEWPQCFDGMGTNGAIAKTFGVTTLPAYIVVDGTTGKVLSPPDEVKTTGINPTLNRILAIREVLSGK